MAKDFSKNITLTSTNELTGTVTTITAPVRALFSFSVSRDIQPALALYTDFSATAEFVQSLTKLTDEELAASERFSAASGLVAMLRRGLMDGNGVRQALQDESPDAAFKNDEAYLLLLRALIARPKITLVEQALLDSPFDGEFWSGVDMREVREQGEQFFRIVRKSR
jgi:hypothetical protein